MHLSDSKQTTATTLQPRPRAWQQSYKHTENVRSTPQSSPSPAPFSAPPAAPEPPKAAPAPAPRQEPCHDLDQDTYNMSPQSEPLPQPLLFPTTPHQTRLGTIHDYAHNTSRPVRPKDLIIDRVSQATLDDQSYGREAHIDTSQDVMSDESSSLNEMLSQPELDQVVSSDPEEEREEQEVPSMRQAIFDPCTATVDHALEFDVVAAGVSLPSDSGYASTAFEPEHEQGTEDAMPSGDVSTLANDRPFDNASRTTTCSLDVHFSVSEEADSERGGTDRAAPTDALQQVDPNPASEQSYSPINKSDENEGDDMDSLFGEEPASSQTAENDGTSLVHSNATVERGTSGVAGLQGLSSDDDDVNMRDLTQGQHTENALKTVHASHDFSTVRDTPMTDVVPEVKSVIEDVSMLRPQSAEGSASESVADEEMEEAGSDSEDELEQALRAALAENAEDAEDKTMVYAPADGEGRVHTLTASVVLPQAASRLLPSLNTPLTNADTERGGMANQLQLPLLMPKPGLALPARSEGVVSCSIARDRGLQIEDKTRKLGEESKETTNSQPTIPGPEVDMTSALPKVPTKPASGVFVNASVKPRKSPPLVPALKMPSTTILQGETFSPMPSIPEETPLKQSAQLLVPTAENPAIKQVNESVLTPSIIAALADAICRHCKKGVLDTTEKMRCFIQQRRCGDCVFKLTEDPKKARAREETGEQAEAIRKADTRKRMFDLEAIRRAEQDNDNTMQGVRMYDGLRYQSGDRPNIMDGRDPGDGLEGRRLGTVPLCGNGAKYVDPIPSAAHKPLYNLNESQRDEMINKWLFGIIEDLTERPDNPAAFSKASRGPCYVTGLLYIFLGRLRIIGDYMKERSWKMGRGPANMVKTKANNLLGPYSVFSTLIRRVKAYKSAEGEHQVPLDLLREVKAILQELATKPGPSDWTG
ncbi:hypothetical protein CLAFUR0_00328 [Fulvia fulva]|nr:hypothetical protein CLAFUR0_00328 [Fulvia fulva]